MINSEKAEEKSDNVRTKAYPLECVAQTSGMAWERVTSQSDRNTSPMQWGKER